MLLHLRWRAVPLLLPLALLAATPALLVWGAALAQSIGLGHLLDNLPMPARAGTRLERLALLGTFWAVTMGGPLAAVALGLLAIVDAELRVDTWELSAGAVARAALALARGAGDAAPGPWRPDIRRRSRDSIGGRARSCAGMRPELSCEALACPHMRPDAVICVWVAAPIAAPALLRRLPETSRLTWLNSALGPTVLTTACSLRPTALHLSRS